MGIRKGSKRKKKFDYNCVNCGKVSKSANHWAKYCGGRCSVLAWAKREQEKMK